MMGEQQRAESLFYYFRLEDQIPNEHLLRLIDQHIDFSFVRERLRNFYSSTGPPSIDPEVLLRLLFGRLSVWDHQRTPFTRRSTHASGVSLVLSTGF